MILVNNIQLESSDNLFDCVKVSDGHSLVQASLKKKKIKCMKPLLMCEHGLSSY